MGNRFGRLVVIRYQGSRSVCRCDCGAEKTVRSHDLRTGKTKSCGCIRLEIITHHGLWKTRTWNSWRGARQRCNNPRAVNYANYGGRGIRFYEPWNVFKNFLEDVGEAPTEEHSIDRIDPNGNYEPGNIRWATPVEQANNKRNHIPTSEDDEEWTF